MVNLNNLLESVRKSDGINDTENTISNRHAARLLIVPVLQLYCLPPMDKSGKLRRLLQPSLRIDSSLERFMENTEAHKEILKRTLYVPL